jgi:tetratricopeptide (TPR) repeat protein
MYQKALELSPDENTIYTAIGIIHHLEGDYFKAVDYYHKALSFCNEENMANELISKAVNHSHLFSNK